MKSTALVTFWLGLSVGALIWGNVIAGSLEASVLEVDKRDLSAEVSASGYIHVETSTHSADQESTIKQDTDQAEEVGPQKQVGKEGICLTESDCDLLDNALRYQNAPFLGPAADPESLPILNWNTTAHLSTSMVAEHAKKTGLEFDSCANQNFSDKGFWVSGKTNAWAGNKDNVDKANVDELKLRFDNLSKVVKGLMYKAFQEVSALAEINTKEKPKIAHFKNRGTWWTAYGKEVQGNVNNSNILWPFFSAWLCFSPNPGDEKTKGKDGGLLGYETSSMYYIAIYDWIANTQSGLEFNQHPAFRDWFRIYHNVNGEYLHSANTQAVVKRWHDHTVEGGLHEFRMSDYAVPNEGFQSFHDFFLRWVPEGARVITHKGNDDMAITAPSDGTIFWIAKEATSTNLAGYKVPTKGGDWVAPSSFGDKYSDKFEGGALIDILLWFTDFHHFFSPVEGEVVYMETIEGWYNHNLDEFFHGYDFEGNQIENYNKHQITRGGDTVKDNVRATWYTEMQKQKRHVWVIDTKDPDIGLVGMLAIGFWGVATIVVDPNKPIPDHRMWPKFKNGQDGSFSTEYGGKEVPALEVGSKVKKGSYLGHFGYGGSSIVLAFEKKCGFDSRNLFGDADDPGTIKAMSVIGFCKR